MEPDQAPWERIQWSTDRVQRMFRDWGIHCTKNRKLEKAHEYFDKCIELQPDDHRALMYRSRVKRYIGQPDKALEDSLAAAQIDQNDAVIDLEICNGLFERNQFEKLKVELHDNARKYHGNKRTDFEERGIVINETFNDTLGDSLTPFMFKHGKVFATVLEEEYHQRNPDRRPVWKQQIEQGKCDVLSVLEKEEIELSPREIARRERSSRVVNQIYLGRTWTDLQFLKDLRNNQTLQLDQAKISSEQLEKIANESPAAVKKFLKNLQARSPLYNEREQRCPNKQFCDRYRQALLYRVQSQTRRNMYSILRNMKEMRALGKIEKVSNYVEEVMGDYVVLKTNRVMPWKLEFVHEVYNMLALAHADRYMEVKTLPKSKGYECLMELLQMPNEKQKGPVKFVFGDRSTFQQPDLEDKVFIAYKKFIARLEKRLVFAKHCIEKSYLLHEMARKHMKQGHFHECSSAARKAIEEAKECGSLIWEFLSTMLIFKANAVLHKIERSQEILVEAGVIAQRLKSPKLVGFIGQCQTINEEQMMMKKFASSYSSMAGRRLSHISSVSSRASRSKTSFSVVDLLKEVDAQ